MRRSPATSPWGVPTGTGAPQACDGRGPRTSAERQTGKIAAVLRYGLHVRSGRAPAGDAMQAQGGGRAGSQTTRRITEMHGPDFQ